MDTLYIIITVLVGLLGLSGGIGIAHFGIMKKLNETIVDVAKNGQQIKTLFTSQAGTVTTSNETIALVREIVSQNNLLIQKITIGT